MYNTNWGPFRRSFVILMLTGLVLYMMSRALTWQKSRVSLWRTSDATVTSSEFKASSTQKDLVEVHFEFVYEYDSVRYSSTGAFASTVEEIQGIHQAFTPGQKIKVFVNSAAPTEAIANEQYLRQAMSPLERIGVGLTFIAYLPILIGVVIEVLHTIAQIRSRSWNA